MGSAVDVILNVQEVASRIARDSGKGPDEDINYPGLDGLHPDIWNLPCGCSLKKGNGASASPGVADRKVPTVHILKDGAVIHMACGKEIAHIERSRPNGGI